MLLGDAAHAMAPNLRQGANSAIVDAVVLAAELAAAQPLEQALGRYAARRLPAVGWVQDAADTDGLTKRHSGRRVEQPHREKRQQAKGDQRDRRGREEDASAGADSTSPTPASSAACPEGAGGMAESAGTVRDSTPVPERFATLLLHHNTTTRVATEAGTPATDSSPAAA